MATFHYRAVTSAGQWQQGTREGTSERKVAQDLRSQGLVAVYVGPSQESAAAPGGWWGALRDSFAAAPSVGSGLNRKLRWGASRVTARDRLLFTQELSTLLNAGVPLDRALSVCSELTESAAFRETLAGVLRQVRSGQQLAEALEAQGTAFSRLYVNMVRAGQASGTLHLVFARLAEFEESSAEWRSHLISSLIYPALLTLVAAGSIVVLMNFVVPRFAQVFESTGLPVPLPTYLLLRSSEMMESYGWLALLAAVGGGFLLRRFLRTAQGREKWDRWQLRLPLVGDLVRRAETARFAKTMATLLGHGVPLVQSLLIVKETLGNRVMAASVDGVAQAVKRGEGIAAPFRKAGVFPPLAGHLLLVGEETGRLDSMFERLAGIYENETRTLIRRLTALFEPAVILGMGLAVGAIVLSLLLAITSINDVPF